MQAIPRTLRTAAMGMALTAALVAQTPASGDKDRGASSHDTYQQQKQGNSMGSTDASKAGTASNPGFGEQVPNDVTQSGGQPHLNSTYQKDRNGNQGLDLGWLGLLGLAGLFGIGRGRRTETTVHHEMQNSGSNRS